MTKREQFLKGIVDLDELHPYFIQLNAETDRGCAILAASMFDGLLEALLRKRMLAFAAPDEIFSGYGPLSSLSAKIDLSFYFGFISKGERDELHRIRRIRNEFAHSLDVPLSFSSQPICDHVAELRLHRIGSGKSSKRNEFEISVLILLGFLHVTIQRAEPPTPPRDRVDELLATNRRSR